MTEAAAYGKCGISFIEGFQEEDVHCQDDLEIAIPASVLGVGLDDC